MRYDRNCAWDKIIGRLKWNKEILILFLPVWLPYLGIDPGMLPTSGYGLTYVRIHALLHEWLNASSCSLWLLSTQWNAADDTDKDIFDKLYQVIFRPPWYNVIIILTNARSTFSASSREMKCEKSVDFYKQIGTLFANKSTTDYGKCLLFLCQANDLCTTDIHFPANLTSSSSLTTGDLDQDLVGRFGPPQNNHGFHRNPPPYPDPDSDAIEFISTAPPPQQWWSQPRDQPQVWPCRRDNGIPMEAALVSTLLSDKTKLHIYNTGVLPILLCHQIRLQENSAARLLHPNWLPVSHPLGPLTTPGHPTQAMLSFNPCTASCKRPCGKAHTRWLDVVGRTFRSFQLSGTQPAGCRRPGPRPADWWIEVLAMQEH